MPRTFHTFDLVIIGGGVAGMAALREARRHTDNVMLISERESGCAYLACVPSKIMAQTARLYHLRHAQAQAGISGVEALSVAIPEILKRVRARRDAMQQAERHQAEDYSVHIVRGRARFETPTTLRADSRLIHTRRTIIATGSSPFLPLELKPLRDQIVTVDTLFEQQDLPPRLAVMGLGPIGMELAQALARLGTKVTAIESGARIGGITDAAINRAACDMLARDMTLWLEARPKVQRGTGLRLEWRDERVEVDKLLLTLPRQPNLSGLGLNKLGVPINGVLPFNRRTMQLADLPIYLAGDATNERTLWHEADDEGRRAAYHALTGDDQMQPYQALLSMVFTDPVVALIGEGVNSGRDRIGEAAVTALPQAEIVQQRDGRLRVALDKDSGTITGAELMMPEGEHLAHLLACAVELRLTAEQMLRMPFYHPGFEEAVKRALKHATATQRKGILA